MRLHFFRPAQAAFGCITTLCDILGYHHGHNAARIPRTASRDSRPSEHTYCLCFTGKSTSDAAVAVGNSHAAQLSRRWRNDVCAWADTLLITDPSNLAHTRPRSRPRHLFATSSYPYPENELPTSRRRRAAPNAAWSRARRIPAAGRLRAERIRRRAWSGTAARSPNGTAHRPVAAGPVPSATRASRCSRSSRPQSGRRPENHSLVSTAHQATRSAKCQRASHTQRRIR